ncbi:hypothetical protein P700755_002688 [Psychroflexus torquis ATCC 700755]|uniref:CpXC domain-containing protein n=1 Tax=Psychroflexus torquis (strain ATCC 700755 / CIP 106069 / ACAM 623) TaxID=313595 RepID=K4IGD8_PSYTT|nr:hypothetical protein [Psychroflexus torquis]AFU69429.1 hypothetical protein P700755_002688 [Psychroflexus torquis ATCC 700755]
MISNTINYTLLCKSCNKRFPNLTSFLTSAESFQNYSRHDLLNVFSEKLLERNCEVCGTKGNYAVWEIWCGARPKQIHIQLQKSGSNKSVNIWDQNQRYLNDILQTLPLDDLLCILLLHAVTEIKAELDSWNNGISETSIRDGNNGDIFYCIYEERDFMRPGSIVFVNNNFSHSEIYNLLLWIRKVHVFKD